MQRGSKMQQFAVVKKVNREYPLSGFCCHFGEGWRMTKKEAFATALEHFMMVTQRDRLSAVADNK